MARFTSRSRLYMVSAFVKLAVLLLRTRERLYRPGWLEQDAMVAWIGQIRALRRTVKRLSSPR